MRIIAIDPGYDRVGIAVIEKKSPQDKEVLVFSECFTTSSKNNFYTRLHEVGQEIAQVIEHYAPKAMAMETLYFSKNQKTALQVSEARGIIAYEAMKASLVLFEYMPAAIKIAVTGYGKSDKAQVIGMVPKLIRIEKKISHDDEYDAISVGLTCFAHEGRNFFSKK